jgi:hypothetical protein
MIAVATLEGHNKQNGLEPYVPTHTLLGWQPSKVKLQCEATLDKFSKCYGH